MKVIFPGPIDARREIELRGKIAAEHQEAWKAAIESVFELFNSLVSAGGLLCRVVESEPQKLSGRLEWERESFIYTWPKFPFDAIGLGVVFRLLGYLRHGGTISIQGTPIAPDHASAIKGMDDIEDRLPHMMPSLPFELEICPTGAWITMATGDDDFGVGIDGPTVADDFLEWHCLMTGVPLGSLSCLVNIFGHFSKEIYPFSAVYIG